MTKDECLEALRKLHGDGDAEINHSLADDILLEYINDQEITEAFEAINRWYA